jgi:tripartite-type tricarboxylate transporter receptor subunit TctC
MFKRSIVLATLTALLWPAAAIAQDKWPSKPVTVIVPFGAGGNTDVLARIFAERLGQKYGQQFVIENRAGAGGTTGILAMTKAAPDGYTLGIGTASGLMINPLIMKERLGYNAEKDIAYLYNMASQPNVMVVHPSVPAKTLPEFVAWLKANPDTAYATAGIGSSQHLCGEMLAVQAGVKVAAVAYRASNQIMQDLISGQVKFACDNFATAWEQIKAGNVRAIAVTSPQRYSFLPDVPTFAETLPGFEVIAWFGWVAPSGIPKDIAAKIAAELVAIGENPEVKKLLFGLGVEPSGMAGDAYAAYTKSQRAAFGPIIEKTGIVIP